MDLAALRTPEGDAALAAAARVAGDDPLAAASALRAQGVPPDLAAAALTQATLRVRAAGKFGPDATRMFFTRAGLEQATRAVVARRRAQRLRAAGVRTLADLGCGLGADAIAAARAGIRVYGVEADAGTAAMAAANAEAAGVADLVTVVHGDATAFDLSNVDAVFCDPARRSADTGRRVFDPAGYSPPWPFVVGLVERSSRVVLKVAPGIDHALVPPGAEAEWVSVDGEVVEAALWCGRLATVSHRATVVRSGTAGTGGTGLPRPSERVAHLVGSPDVRATVGNVRPYLYDPDGAVVRSHLVGTFASTVDGVLADQEIAYVYSERAVDTPFARRLLVREAHPFSLKRLRSRLRDLHIGRLEVMKRGSALDPQRLRRDLRLDGREAATVVLTRIAGRPSMLICSTE